jgi:hypothetical protein
MNNPGEAPHKWIIRLEALPHSITIIPAWFLLPDPGIAILYPC